LRLLDPAGIAQTDQITQAIANDEMAAAALDPAIDPIRSYVSKLLI